MMYTAQPTGLVIREHDFQKAKNSLKKYTEQAQKEVELACVPNDGGLFRLGDHKVTGSEMNNITSQIQSYLISLNNLGQGLVEEFGQVYQAFESLDKDYIQGIVASIQAAAEVSKKEQEDKKKINALTQKNEKMLQDIDALVSQHETSVTVLKKFKADIDRLKHLRDIDKVWELLGDQAERTEELDEYITNLSKLEHLHDVDVLYNELEKLGEEFTAFSEAQIQYAARLDAVCEDCRLLYETPHIRDIDELWNNHASLADEVQGIQESVENQKNAICDILDILQHMRKAHKQFSDATNELHKDFDNRLKFLAGAQEAKLNQFEQGQTAALNSMKIYQEEKLAQMSAVQLEKLEQIANNQSNALTQISAEFQNEKNVLEEKAQILMQRLKLSYVVAGSAVAISVIQFLLNLLGVL